MQGIAPIHTKEQEYQPTLADMYQKDHAYYLGQLEKLSAQFAALRRINLISPRTVSDDNLRTMAMEIDRFHRTLALHAQVIKGGVVCVQ